jgi:transglutaminase superfamily protein/transglutaminase TgpA-like protein/uncharacterized protein DUF4129
MNHRLTIAAAVAVMLASISEYVLIDGASWLFASFGAVIIAALAGTLTRMAPMRAAIGATILAAAVSVPLLADHSLWLKLAGLILIGCTAASASPVRMFKPFADLVTYLAALLLYLNLTMAATRSYLWLIPSAKSLQHLSTLASNGSAVTKYAPPIADSHGVVLLTAGSIGLAAIVVDIIAVRLHRPAIAGLPLLVIYMAPIATAAKIGGAGGVLTFLLAALGYLALLAADGRNRLAGWGRVVTVWHYAGDDERLGGADVRGLAATGRRIGFAAVCAAIVAPLLLPTLNLHQLFGEGHGGGGGPVQAGLPSPVDQMNALLSNPSNLPVLSYQSQGANTGQYLGVYVLNYSPAHGIWTLIKPSPSIFIGANAPPSPPGVAATTTITSTSTTFKLDNVAGSSTGYANPIFFLPVPYFPTQLTLPGNWNESTGTLMIFSGSGNHSGMRYTVVSGQVDVTPAEEASTAPIPKSIQQTYLGFKSPVTKQLTAIANQITKNAATPFAKAKALEAYFQSDRFTYTLKPTNLRNSARGLLTFLTKTRQGSCEQFAFAMAALSRLVGIPTRVAIGFTSGTRGSGRTWDVTTADAHAWPELYFPKLGWLRFEPTPGGSDGQGSATQPSYAVSGSSGTGPGGSNNISSHGGSGTSPLTGVDSNGTHVRAPAPGGGGPVGPIVLPQPGTPLPIGQILLGVLIVLLVGASVPAITRVVSRRRRWRAASDDAGLASAAWLEICADLDDFGLSHRVSETPRALARRLAVDESIDDSARAAIGRITTVVEQTRYAPEPASAAGIRTDVAQVRRSLSRSSSFWTRLRARLWPTSTIQPLMSGLWRVFGQRTGWVTASAEI